ncbi:MAG: class I SAM-dependent methyltransferase [Treponema sp.]|jgi:O-methyltransferase involved in polyketide biosynthesis|nr:class I SAM-dependent methyltransferase [Treponema sp.]
MANQDRLTEQSIQSTMLIPLYGRMIAGKRFPDILRDHAAERICETVNYDFSGISKTYGSEYAALTCLIRAARMDDHARTYIAAHPDGVVINLGAGLDDTFSRVDNGAVHWYNLDLPDAIAYREHFIQSSERCHSIAKSMFDYTWLEEVNMPPDSSVCVLAAGLFFFFEEKELRELTSKLCGRFSHGELFFEACSRSGMKIANKMVKKTGNTGVEMKFWVDNPASLKAWSPKITQTASYSFFGSRYKDMRLAKFTRFIMWGADFLKRTKFVSVKW